MVLRGIDDYTVETTVLGQKINFPVGIAPTVGQVIYHPEGDYGPVRGAVRMGAIMTLNSLSVVPLEDIAASVPSGTVLWMQTYMYPSRDTVADIAKRAERSGFQALVVTIDEPFTFDIKCNARHRFFHEKIFPLGTPNIKSKDKTIDPTVSFDDITWLSRITTLPIIAKGILSDDSRSDTGRAGSGIFSNTPRKDVKISTMNSNYCSVFRSELIAITGALDHTLNSNKDSIWILTDSRSSIQHLKNWPKIMDSTGLDIISKFASLGQRKQVCLQWIPSHVGVPRKEAADELAGRGCDLPNPSLSVLSHSEIHSLHKVKMILTWRNPPAHHWYAAKSPDLSLQCRSSRALQTALTHLRTGHMRGMTFVQGIKSFFTCLYFLPTSPAHLLVCWGISLGQLFEDQDLVCDNIIRKGQLDLV
ncbi:hydroxyacid oxidase 1 [Trichonephila clavipes]|nr:hydroxyacid oxidase 1 [Trichonephila clavipes]